MASINETTSECNGTFMYSENLTDGYFEGRYIEDCLGVRCMTVEECSDHIKKHITPRLAEWFIIIIYIIIGFVGLVGNGLVCFVVIRTSHMRTVVNIFIVNLAVADFLVLLICLPPSVLADTTESWYMGDIMCRVVPFLQTVSIAVSVLTLCAIAIERYFAICHPLRRRLTASTVLAFIVVIWCIAIAVALPELLYQKLHRWYPEHVTPYLQYCAQTLSKEQQKYYQIGLLVGLYDVPMCLMFFAYSTIAVRLWKDRISNNVNSRVNSGSGRRGQVTALKARRKAAKMLMTIVILFGICYLPIHILNILRYQGTLHEMDDNVVIIWALFARGICYFNSATNPLIYNFMSAKFRQEFRAAFGRCTRSQVDNTLNPLKLYSFRAATRTNGHHRSYRYSMNTCTTRPFLNGNTSSSSQKSQF
ncbi:orexin receptor type 2-like [Dreissena polymorpha]|uniref:G-protein coupled receptors family 1 profile domain-containing protein n=1 Tax=Dreissena polymorpha TaxID=45954 RepID=A0A9D4QYC0_DREPO|nr:orexin receptor type 2-like [Dreissena polymorpha]KAH3847378.1 hypothetical protein DPMN_089699 [Dreissena polymorpha]